MMFVIFSVFFFFTSVVYCYIVTLLSPLLYLRYCVLSRHDRNTLIASNTEKHHDTFFAVREVVNGDNFKKFVSGIKVVEKYKVIRVNPR